MDDNPLENVSQSSKLRGHLAMLGANLAWGLMAPVSKEVLNSGLISPLGLSGVRIMAATVLFWLLSALVPDRIIKKERIARCDYFKIAVASILMVAANQAVYIMGVGYTSPIDASVVCSMTPIFTMILAALFIRERITPLKTLGVLIGLGGALVFVLSGEANVRVHATNPLLGNSLCVIAQLCAAVYYVAFRRVISKYSPFTMMKWMFLISAVAIAPFTMGEIVKVDWKAFPMWGFADIAFIVVAATFIAYLLIPYSQRRIKPTLIAMYNYLQPVMSALYSAILGLAIITGIKVLSTLMIFLGVWIVTQSKNTQTWTSLFGRTNRKKTA